MSGEIWTRPSAYPNHLKKHKEAFLILGHFMRDTLFWTSQNNCLTWYKHRKIRGELVNDIVNQTVQINII
jgi:hypothetical protein